MQLLDIKVLQAQKSGLIANSKMNCRLDPEISGGGYFHEIAPHHIDLIQFFFDQSERASGFSAYQEHTYKTDDIVNDIIW